MKKMVSLILTLVMLTILMGVFAHEPVLRNTVMISFGINIGVILFILAVKLASKKKTNESKDVLN